MKYQIITGQNHEDVAAKVNAQLAEGWKPLDGIQFHAYPTQVQTVMGAQMGLAIVFAQSLVHYEDKTFKLPGASQ